MFWKRYWFKWRFSKRYIESLRAQMYTYPLCLGVVLLVIYGWTGYIGTRAIQIQMSRSNSISSLALIKFFAHSFSSVQASLRHRRSHRVVQRNTFEVNHHTKKSISYYCTPYRETLEHRVLSSCNVIFVLSLQCATWAHFSRIKLLLLRLNVHTIASFYL